jgi:alkylation response protein AidB-like acyl-CoA dehydrogenase
MNHYRSNLRDLRFTLFDVLGRAEAYGHGAFANTAVETAEAILSAVEELAVKELAPSHVDADRHPPVFDAVGRTVKMPDSFKRAYAKWMEGEWHLLDLPADLGGGAIPPSLRWAVAELGMGANPALYMYQGVGGFARVLNERGTPQQKALARTMAQRGWGATMCLTEPEAGSDVGAVRTTAVQQDDGTWHVKGVKRFITSGEHDLSDNIVHFVLARPEGAGPGTRGLSLFLVPKFHIADLETGELGARNGVYATALEDKMGLKASATCELTFGAEEPAVGMLLGEVHDGIRQMFGVLEQARMSIGAKSAATMSTAYLTAVAYARERVQGADLAAMADKNAPRVPITRHPDVRRSLLLQKAYAEGMRALVLYAATVQDRIAQAEADGLADAGAKALNDLLLPIVKGYCSERACEQLNQSLQVLGGSGYMKDFPLEQYVRDTKVDTVYEGTTAIQGLDLFFRKIVRDHGRAFAALLAEIEKTLAEVDGAAFATERELLATAVNDLRGLGAWMGERVIGALRDPSVIYDVGRNTTRFLMAAGDVLVAWLLLRQAAVAAQRVSSDGDAYYRGKIATAAFFAQEVLPLITAQVAIGQRRDTTTMTFPDEAW